MSVLGSLDKWKKLDSKERRKIETEEKDMRKEILSKKNMKFGKAGGARKLSWLEETLLTNQTRKKIELQEALKNRKEMNIENVPEGWKEDGSKPNPEGRKIQEEKLQRKAQSRGKY